MWLLGLEKHTNTQQMLKKFNDFRTKINTRVYFSEKRKGAFEKNTTIQLKGINWFQQMNTWQLMSVAKILEME